MKSMIFSVAIVLGGTAHFCFAAEDASSPAITSPAYVTPSVDVRVIIDSVSHRLHKKFLIDPRVGASVSLVGVQTNEVTYPLLLTILSVHGFFVYEQDGVLVVSPDATLRVVPSGPVGPVLDSVPDADIVTTVIELKNTGAPPLVPVLRPLMPQNAQLAAVADHNALILVDRAGNARRLVALIRELDKLPVVKRE